MVEDLRIDFGGILYVNITLMKNKRMHILLDLNEDDD